MAGHLVVVAVFVVARRSRFGIAGCALLAALGGLGLLLGFGLAEGLAPSLILAAFSLGLALLALARRRHPNAGPVSLALFAVLGATAVGAAGVVVLLDPRTDVVSALEDAFRMAEESLVPPDVREVPTPTTGEFRYGSCVDATWICRAFTWEYRGASYLLEMDLDPSAYAHYREAEKPFRHREENGRTVAIPAYDAYVTDPHDDAFVSWLADALRDLARQGAVPAGQELSFVLAFVQGLPYTSDDVTTEFDEYPRYPLETLVDGGGDCEDTSILLASLAQAMGHHAVLLSPPEHLAVGIGVPSGGQFEHAGQSYAYAETTGDGWGLGEVPPAYEGVSVVVYPLVPAPLFTLEASVESGRNGQVQVAASSVNTGTLAADGVRLRAWIEDRWGNAYSTDVCDHGTVVPHARVACTLRLDLATVPRGVEVRLVVRVHDDAFWYDQATGSYVVAWQ